jgi:hypothetical protein
MLKTGVQSEMSYDASQPLAQPNVGALMLPPTEAEWMQHRDSIWYMYVFQQMEQKELLLELKRRGFSVTYVPLYLSFTHLSMPHLLQLNG